MITKKQAEQVLPHVRAAVAALHEVWEKCREVEQTLGRDLDGLEGGGDRRLAAVDKITWHERKPQSSCASAVIETESQRLWVGSLLIIARASYRAGAGCQRAGQEGSGDLECLLLVPSSAPAGWPRSNSKSARRFSAISWAWDSESLSPNSWV